GAPLPFDAWQDEAARRRAISVRVRGADSQDDRIVMRAGMERERRDRASMRARESETPANVRWTNAPGIREKNIQARRASKVAPKLRILERTRPVSGAIALAVSSRSRAWNCRSHCLSMRRVWMNTVQVLMPLYECYARA